ncbi:axoneme-associated protein mst101(2)-like [Paramacrobiotus metropolitanus]|uniref:axoneme-associated protein mst101(2)-like n=1 Tax=Paramacrobiotus metropolitanus TaxID=2943436 RepID=UPI0024463AD4|nr:axoneme-associated protein mst101(2)-like [Paramacrobiotus metropolitanus]
MMMAFDSPEIPTAFTNYTRIRNNDRPTEHSRSGSANGSGHERCGRKSVESSESGHTDHSAMESQKEEESEKKEPDESSEEEEQLEDAEGQTLFCVEAVKAVRGKRGEREFFIKWHGYPDSDNTWEPEEGVGHLEIVQDFLKELDQKAARIAKRKKEEADRLRAQQKAARKQAKEAARKKEERRHETEKKKNFLSSSDDETSDTKETEHKAEKKAKSESDSEKEREEKEKLARKKAKREARERERLEEEEKRKAEKKQAKEKAMEQVKDSDSRTTETESPRKEKPAYDDEAAKAARKKAKRERQEREAEEIRQRLKAEKEKDRERKAAEERKAIKEIELEKAASYKQHEKKVPKQKDPEPPEKHVAVPEAKKFAETIKVAEKKAKEESHQINKSDKEKEKPVKKKNDAASLFFGAKSDKPSSSGLEMRKNNDSKEKERHEKVKAGQRSRSNSVESVQKAQDQKFDPKKNTKSSMEAETRKTEKQRDKKPKESIHERRSRSTSIELQEKKFNKNLESQKSSIEPSNEQSWQPEKKSMEVAKRARSSSIEFGENAGDTCTSVLSPKNTESLLCSAHSEDQQPPEIIALEKKAEQRSRSNSMEIDERSVSTSVASHTTPTVVQAASTSREMDREVSPEIAYPMRYGTLPVSAPQPYEASDDESGDEDDEDGEPQFEVRKIVEDKWSEDEGCQMYFVQWLGYDSDDDTWEPEENLKHLDVFKEYLQQKAEKAKKKEEKKKEKERVKSLATTSAASKVSTSSSDEEEERERKKKAEKKAKKLERENKLSTLSSARPAQPSRKMTHMDKVFGMQEEDSADAEVQVRKDAVMNKSYRINQLQRPLDDAPRQLNVAPVKNNYEALKEWDYKMKIPKTSDAKAPSAPAGPVRKPLEVVPPVQYVTEADGIFKDVVPQDMKYLKLVFDTSTPLPEPRDPKPFMTYAATNFKLPYMTNEKRFDGLFNRVQHLKRPDPSDPPLVTDPKSMFELSSVNRFVAQHSRSNAPVLVNYCDHFRKTLWPRQADEEKNNENFILREMELFLKFQAKNRAVEEYLEKRDGVTVRRKAVKRIQRVERRRH